MDLVTSLDRTRPTRRQWRDWQHREKTLVGLSYDTARSRLYQRGNDCGLMQDRLLTAFVHIARCDSYATQVIASCLRPALNARVSRYHRGLGRDEAWAILLASLCQRIERYDTTRQPRYIARNLLWVPTRELHKAALASRQRAARTVALDHTTKELADPTADITLSARWLLDNAVDANILTQYKADLIHDVRCRDVPLRTAAEHRGISYEATRKCLWRSNQDWATWWQGTPHPPPACRTTANRQEAK